MEYVPTGTFGSLLGPVGSVSSQPGSGPNFKIIDGSGSVQCSTFTGLFGFGYEFLDPCRPLL